MQPSLRTNKGVYKYVFQSVNALNKIWSKKLKASEEATDQKIETVSQTLGEKFEAIVKDVSVGFASIQEKLFNRVKESEEKQSKNFSETLENNSKKLRETILKGRLADSKTFQESIQKLHEKADSIVSKIPKGGILDYVVDDKATTEKNLRTAKKTSDTITKVVDEKTRYLGGGGGGVWGEIAGDITVQQDLQAVFTTKQNTLVSGTNIKTINGESILGSGDVSISAATGGSNGNIQYNDGGAFQGDDKFNYDEATNKLSNLADYGAELAPALTTGNWDLGTGLVFLTGPDRIAKTGDGSGYLANATPSAATWVVPGQRYKIEVDITVTVGYALVSIGSNPQVPVVNTGQYMLPSTGTYTFYITAGSNEKFTILAGASNSRWEINSVSVQAVTDGTGDALIQGDITTHSLVLQGTINSPRVRYYDAIAGTYNNVVFGSKVRYVETIFTGTHTFTGISNGQEEGDEMFIHNASSGVLTFAHNNAGSTDINRFSTSTFSDLSLGAGEMAYLKYFGGNTNRWLVFKISSNSTYFNSSDFQGVLNTFLINSGQMTLGAGNSMVRVSDSDGKTTVGDVDENSNKTKTEWDDDTRIVTDKFGQRVYIDPQSNNTMQEFTAGDGTFASRKKYIAARILVEESLSGWSSDIPDSTLVEFRSTNATGEGFKGTMPFPVMTQNDRDGIASPVEGLYIHNSDTHKLNFRDANANAWQEVTSTTAP